MNDSVKKLVENQFEIVKKNLINNQFAVDVFESKEDLVPFLKENIKKGSIVGCGGSMSLVESGVLSWLEESSDYVFLDRNKTDDVDKVLKQQLNSDVYLSSTNALLLSGSLYNIDGRGNRVAALCYGPSKVYVVVGYNKLVNSLEEAEARIERYAAIANNIRLNKDNPCVKVGKCVKCNLPSTICNSYVYTRRSGIKDRVHILLVKESLGY